MVVQIARDRSLRMMRAVPDIVDPRALGGKFGNHPVVQLVEFVLGEEAPRHAGLIGEEEHEITGIVQPPDRLRRIRHPADPLLGPHIAVAAIVYAVASEKSCGPAPRSLTLHPPPL